jgi:PAS domain S-box-containing protein
MNTRDPPLESAAEALETPRREWELGPQEALRQSADHLPLVIDGQTAGIKARKWAEEFLAGEKRVLEMTAKGHPLPLLLEALCRLVEAMASGSVCSILLLEADGKQLRHGAAPSLPASYAKAIDGSVIGPATGPCGRAAYLRGPVIVSDIATDPIGSGYRDLALAHGLRACWSTPIQSSAGTVLGTFAIYWHEPCRPTAQHQKTIEQITDLAAVAIERKQSQDALHAAKARFEGILAIAEDAIISVDSSQHIVLFNQGAEKAFGYAETEVIGKPLALLLPQRFVHAHRGHIEQFAASSEVSRSMGQRREVFGRRRDGTEFPAEASISKLDLGSEVVFTVILRDITERKRAAEALRASEHLARGQLDALTRLLDSLAQESDPDKLLEQVLRTIAEQSGAHSVSVWNRNDESGWLGMVAVIEDDRFQTRNDAVHPAAELPLLAQNHPVWSEVLRTGQHAVLEDIDRETARMRVGSEPDALWHRVMEETDPDPAVALLKKHLRGLGVCAILAVPMLIAGRVAGIIGIRFKEKRLFRKEEIELTRALAHQATLAIQLMRLARQSRQAAVTAERNRMARDIHDTLAQGFTGVIVQLEAAEEAMSQNLAAKAAGHLNRTGELAREGLREARRSVRALRPQALEEQDLWEAMEGLVRKLTAGTSLRAEFILEGETKPLPPEWDASLLRICQEVLTNALRHAQAREFKVWLVFEPKELRLKLRDDGCGFDPAGRHDGFGLQGIRERVEGMGGQLSLQSAKGKGTAVSIVLPFPGDLEPATA